MVNVSCSFYTFANLIVESGLYNQTEAWQRLLGLCRDREYGSSFAVGCGSVMQDQFFLLDGI